MHNAQIPSTVFSNLFHMLVHVGKGWNSMVCSQETPGLLGPATPSVTRISRPAFLQSMPLKNRGEALFSIIHRQTTLIQLFSRWTISRQAV